MDNQLIFVIILFALALFLVVRRIVLTIQGKKKAGCADCGIAEKSK